jgi:hypothetical protein
MKRTYLVVISSVIIITVVIVLTLMQVRSVRSGPQASTPTPSGWPDYPQFNPTTGYVPPSMPTAVQPKITDLAPDIPYEDKPSVVVQHADGSKERYLLAPDMLDTFINNLPKGDKFVGDIPPPALLMTYEAPASTEIP